MDNSCKHLITETYKTTNGLDGPLGGPYGTFGTKCANCGYILTTGWWDGTRTIDKPKMPEVSVSIVDNYYNMSMFSNAEFGVKIEIKDVWEKMNKEERDEYYDIIGQGTRESGFLKVPPNSFVKCFDFCSKMKEKYG